MSFSTSSVSSTGCSGCAEAPLWRVYSPGTLAFYREAKRRGLRLHAPVEDTRLLGGDALVRDRGGPCGDGHRAAHTTGSTRPGWSPPHEPHLTRADPRPSSTCPISKGASPACSTSPSPCPTSSAARTGTAGCSAPTPSSTKTRKAASFTTPSTLLRAACSSACTPMDLSARTDRRCPRVLTARGRRAHDRCRRELTAGPARLAPSSVAARVAVARRGSTSFVLAWRLRALHVDPLLVDGEPAWTEEGRGAVGTRDIASHKIRVRSTLTNICGRN